MDARINVELSDLFFNYEHMNLRMLMSQNRERVNKIREDDAEAEIALTKDAVFFIENYSTVCSVLCPGVTPAMLVEDYSNRM